MTDAEKAFEAAEREIARVADVWGTTLDLNKQAFHALEELPAAISALSNLQTLYFNNTQVTDIAPLAGFSNLQVLSFGNTQITDITPLAGLSNLKTLFLYYTQVTNIAPLAGLSNLQNLLLDGTLVADITPLAEHPALSWIHLNETQVADFRPLLSIPGLKTHERREIGFSDTEAVRQDPELARLAEVEDLTERTDQTLAYLATLPEWPAPLVWAPPQDQSSEGKPPEPAEDEIPRLDVTESGIELHDSPIDAADLSDPIKQRLYPKLQDAVRDLNRYANRYPEITGPVTALLELTKQDFAQTDLLDIHLEMATLTDLREANATRPDLEKVDADCLTALNTVLRIGPGVTLGHPDVDVLEKRLADYARQRTSATVAEGERLVASGIAGQKDIAGERLRDRSDKVAKAGDTGRVAEYRRSLTKNTILALAAVAEGIGAAATGYVYGTVTVAAAQFLITHADAIMATAPAWGETGAKWLEYMLMRAQDVISAARRRDEDDD